MTAAPGHSRVVAAGPLTLSPALKAAGAMIPAFANKEQLRPHSMVSAKAVPDNRYAPNGPYWFTDLKQAYDYPSYQAVQNGKPLDGTGANVAILMSGDVSDADTAFAFNHEHFTAVTGLPVPTVNRLPVDGGNIYDPGGPNGTVEASLDVQMVTGGAPGANTTLVTIPDLSDQHIMDGYTAIIQANAYDIVSSSFGGPEAGYLPGFNGGQDFTFILDIYEGLFEQGNAQGITFIASSGDSGGLSFVSLSYLNPDPRVRAVFVPGVETPAVSPSVTSVGGGNLITTYDPVNFQSTYVAENGLGDPEKPHDPYGFGKAVSGGYWAQRAVSANITPSRPISSSCPPGRPPSGPFPTWGCRSAVVRAAFPRRPAARTATAATFWSRSATARLHRAAPRCRRAITA